MSDVTRRNVLEWMAAGALVGCSSPTPSEPKPAAEPPPEAATSPILGMVPLGMHWPTTDPFLFCAHHDDHYPAGNDELGPAASLQGRNLGRDFAGIDGWRMYHGERVPGFPHHPHRGFETVTIVRKGLVDHADSLGAAARYGQGDVQWLTAGGGILHSEMMPLLDRDRSNPLELFQVWLNLPRTDKMAPPYFTMFWGDTVPRWVGRDEDGRAIEITMVAGTYEGLTPPAPPPNSWASRPDSDVAIWTIKLAAHARWTLPAARPGVNRMLYFFRGTSLQAADRTIPSYHGLSLEGARDIALQAGDSEVELLLLQGRPIGEPIARHGPFVMNTQDELKTAYSDYRRTRFGGWPWDRPDPVYPREEGRFARHADGRVERPV